MGWWVGEREIEWVLMGSRRGGGDIDERQDCMRGCVVCWIDRITERDKTHYS